jgi:hypothetical protein
MLLEVFKADCEDKKPVRTRIDPDSDRVGGVDDNSNVHGLDSNRVGPGEQSAFGTAFNILVVRRLHSAEKREDDWTSLTKVLAQTASSDKKQFTRKWSRCCPGQSCADQSAL